MSSIAPAAGKRQIPGNKSGAAVIWIIGAYMTYEFLDQITDLDQGVIVMLAAAIQIVLTLGQSPVWHGRGSTISYALLAVDAIINFGGVMFFMANVDQAGSVQAMGVAFFGASTAWPMFVKGILALFFSAIIAGLPEFLWKLD